MSESTPERRVRLLDPTTINQIAAGEVVERPASVVKELLENALDAGATRIEIEVREAGRARIRISDNGCGMSEEDLDLALLRHATSKIRLASDLHRVETLGFRGEALPSIASVSRFRISTGQEDGVRYVRTVNHAAGGPSRMVDSGRRGTEILVEELFFNVPARLKFLKSDATETGQITELVGRYAVAYPDVAFRLEYGEKGLLETHGDGDVWAALAAVWGREVVAALAEVRAYENGVRVAGMVSGPSFTRATRSQQWLYVNGRPVRHPSLMASVDAAFRSFTPEKRYPIVCLMLAIDPARVDVNVSPTKNQCRFQSEGEVFDAVRRAVKSALLEHGMAPSAASLARANEALQEVRQPGLISNLAPGFGASVSLAGSLESAASAEGRPGLGVAERSAGYWLGSPNADVVNGRAKPVSADSEETRGEWATNRAFAGVADEASDWAPLETLRNTAEGAAEGTRGAMPTGEASSSAHPFEREVSHVVSSAGHASRFLDGLRIFGQTEDCFFILAENRDGVLIIDQHVAHERILFEYLRAERGLAPIERQELLTPVPLEIERRLMEFALERLDELDQAGFRLEPFGGSLLIRSIPAALKRQAPAQALREILEDLLDGTRGAGLTAREQVWVTCACKMAIKAGDRLAMPEMEKLLLDLAQTENPYLCPHGRPVTLTLARGELIRKFKR